MDYSSGGVKNVQYKNTDINPQTNMAKKANPKSKFRLPPSLYIQYKIIGEAIAYGTTLLCKYYRQNYK